MLNLIWRNILYRKTLSLLTIISVSLTVALVVVLMLAKAGIEEGATKGYGPFELIVGAAGSESQLVLNSLYHVGTPTGNIPHPVLEKLQSNKEVDKAFAMTTGDNYNGYPIVGIEPAYFPVRYGERSLAKGRLYNQLGEVVIGSHVAKMAGLKIGDTFKGGHGLVEHHEAEEMEHTDHEAEEEEAHSQFIYTVVGILPTLNSADDRALFTTLDYAWNVHHNEKAEQKEITAILVKPKSLGGTQAIKLEYDKLNNTQAVYTSKVVADVVNMVDRGTELITVVTVLCILLATISIALSLVAAIHEKQKDVGLLRLIGKSAAFIWITLIGEGLLITSIGLVLGVLIGHLGCYLGSNMMFEFSGIHINAFAIETTELYLVVGTIVLGILASVGPAYRVYKVETLQLFRS
ncbi:FtsX-like permease family protein [Paenibacillus sp. LMG 31456]|uniref:Putative hemin transport system permease protein HrtB n=1 Tax=Paenibacillus foliorum TaxID=2654974 RepID=A0A972GXZ1_9BACL|nr:FtsX-like permease family protein [Paenibacillus foliorum]NOU92596.1 FtsX-like permease family protein [Paenibacillus foliorum]